MIQSIFNQSSKYTSFTSNSGKHITIRPPTLQDTPSMLEFINQLSVEDIFLNANPKNLYTLEQEEKYVAECIFKIKHNSQVHLLAFHDQKLVGSVTITKQPARKDHVGILGITIAKLYRGDGIGEKLAKLAIEKAASINLSLITLSAFVQNHKAISLYKKIGFVEYGRLPNGFSYQDNYADEILMYKAVGPSEAQP